MSDRLITVAVFHDPVEAAVAKYYLDAQGIPAELIDETTVATDWMLAGAIGGIKLQVEPIHVERAEALLAQVEEDRDAAETEPPPPQTAFASQEIAEEMRAEEADKAPINKLVDRIFRATVFGLVFWPLQLYAFCLLAQLTSEKGKVSPNRRWRVWTSILLSFPVLVMIALLVAWGVGFLTREPASPSNPRWSTFEVKERAFSVRFPHKPSIQSGLGKNDYGQTLWIAWSAMAHQRTYGVSIVTCSLDMADVPRDKVLKNTVAAELTNGAKLLEESKTQLNGVSGTEIVVHQPTQDHERVRVYVRGRELVFVWTRGSADDIGSDEAERFFKSFRFQ